MKDLKCKTNDITVLTLVPNAKDRLHKCLKSVLWADDIFCIVDSKTNDGSKELARQFSKHVVIREYINAANQRNWALSQINTEWTLVLDADEWVSDELAERIQLIIKDPDSLDGYEIRRRSYFMGKFIKYCGWQYDYNVRLFRTKKGCYPRKKVHASVAMDGTVGTIHEPMYHDTYRNFEEYFATFQRFTSWDAEDLFEGGRKVELNDILLRPFLQFLRMYIWHKGFKDGYYGAVLCGLSAYYEFTKYAKVWNLECLNKGRS